MKLAWVSEDIKVDMHILQLIGIQTRASCVGQCGIITNELPSPRKKRRRRKKRKRRKNRGRRKKRRRKKRRRKKRKVKEWRRIGKGKGMKKNRKR